MNNRPIIRCSTFALAAVCSTIALSVANAQSPNSAEQPPKPVKSDRKAPAATSPLVLPPITVSAGSDTKAPFQTPGGVSVIDGKIVQEKFGGDANAIVRSMPGTFTRMSSSQPGVSVNIRGFEADGRVNTMIDGVPQTFRNTAGHASTGGELLYIDTNLLAGIGAERGAVNGAYGMGSLAGAVNFRTIEFEDVVLEGQDRGVKTTVKAGSNGYGASGMVAAGARTDLSGGGQASIVGAFSYGEHGNYQRGDGSYNKPDASNKPGSGLVKLHFQPDDVHDLKLGARWYKNDFLVSGYNWGVDNATYTANYKYQPGSDWIDLRINGYYNRTDMSYDPTTGGSYRKRNTRDFGFGFDIANTSRFDITDELSARWDYGAAYSSNDYKVNLFRGANPPGHMQKARAFSDLTLSQGIFELSAGLNYDYWDLSGRQSPCKPNIGFCPPTGGNVDVSRHESALNPKITLSAKPLDWLQPYVTYSHTFRPPSAREALWALVPIGSGVGGGQYSNFYLNPETSKGCEIGANIVKNDVLYGGDELRLKVNYFNNAIDNYIVNNLISIPGDPYERAIWVNVPGTTHSRGFEVEGGYDAGVAYVNLSYTQASNNQPVGWGAGIGNGDSTFLPESKISVDVGIRAFEEALTVGATMNHVGGSRYAVGFGDTETKEAYTLFNAYASYRFNKNATAFLNVENLTDVAYSPAVSGEMGEKTGRGRTITVGLTTQF